MARPALQLRPDPLSSNFSHDHAFPSSDLLAKVLVEFERFLNDLSMGYRQSEFRFKGVDGELTKPVSLEPEWHMKSLQPSRPTRNDYLRLGLHGLLWVAASAALTVWAFHAS